MTYDGEHTAVEIQELARKAWARSVAYKMRGLEATDWRSARFQFKRARKAQEKARRWYERARYANGGLTVIEESKS